MTVSIHAPTRGATPIKRYTHALIAFQSTHPHGVRLCHILFDAFKKCFNPRTHTGCDRACGIRRGYILCFNPRTHTGCDSLLLLLLPALPPFQSTHPHGVRRVSGRLRCRQRDVSIHAPTRGATPRKITKQHLLKVSIHAPTRGATVE